MAPSMMPAERIWSGVMELTASVEKIVAGSASSVISRLKTGWWLLLKIPCRFRTWMKTTRRKNIVTDCRSRFR